MPASRSTEHATMARVVIVTPALADANNGNWRTAQRWARFLEGTFAVRMVKAWPDAEADGDHAILALHARRSASSVAAWHARHGDHGLGVALTGTDLYRDIRSDPDAHRSLELARALIVLQELGGQSVPEALRPKVRTIFQSTETHASMVKPADRLVAVMVGHLRSEKSPETFFDAALLLAAHPDIGLRHIGAPLDPALGERAEATMRACPGYQWLGSLGYEATRDHIAQAHVLVHCSRMEGGAHVVMEAVASGTPVIASRVDGNVGMLGTDYAGYFDWNDARALAAMLVECRRTQGSPDGLLARLERQAAGRAHLFRPETEAAEIRRFVADLLAP